MPAMLVVPFYILCIAALCTGIWFIARAAGAYNPNGWAFFTGVGIIGGVTLFVWFRSIWWFISGTGDFQGREGLLKRLWNKVFKK